MSSPAIVVDALGKQYAIGGRAFYDGSFRDLLTRTFMAPFKRAKALSGNVGADERFWALDDVSFSVDAGEVLGVIGRNGAGKSTLLKVLTGITEPTKGRVELRGRVASLLEIGTGFHGELTGRENIFLNGAILGMSRCEIQTKFDDIVAFAEVETFIDTPVKRYSSGMYLRLAFAVAAHLDPEILLVDEVLAVGDAAFQKKCLGKMNDVASEGRTVVFVSHNMNAMLSLCRRGVVLERGQVCFDGPIDDAVQAHLSNMDALGDTEAKDREDRSGTGAMKLVSLDTHDDHGLEIGDDFSFTARFEGDGTVKGPIVSFIVKDELGNRIVAAHSNQMYGPLPDADGSLEVCVRLKGMPLLPGGYDVTVALFDGHGHVIDRVLDVKRVNVLGKDPYGTGLLPHRSDGLLAPPCEWDVRAG